MGTSHLGKRLDHQFTFERGLSERSCGFKDVYILPLKYLIVACPTFKIRLHLQDVVSHCGLNMNRFTVKWEYIIAFNSNTLEEDCAESIQRFNKQLSNVQLHFTKAHKILNSFLIGDQLTNL